MKSLGKFLEKKYVPSASNASVGAERKASSRAKPKPIDEKTIFFFAEKILRDEYGKRGMEMLRLARFRDGKLSLRAKSSLWADEARNFRSELLRRLARDLGDGVVKEVKVFHEYGE